MTCRELADFIMDYTTGELPSDVLAAFEGHLALCPNCRAYLSNYLDTVRLGKAAFAPDRADEDVPPSVPEDLVEAILAVRRSMNW